MKNRDFVNKVQIGWICFILMLIDILLTLNMCVLEKKIDALSVDVKTITETVNSIDQNNNHEIDQCDEFVPYPIDLSSDLQEYIIDICEYYCISPELVMSVIYHESNCNPNSFGDESTYGLMGINVVSCADTMDRLNCHNMLDPYQNVTVGIDILADKLYKYDGNPEMALMAYNAGDYGANKYWFSNYIYSTEYSRKIMSMTQKLEEMKEI